MSSGAVTVITVVVLFALVLGSFKPDAREFILDLAKVLRGQRKVPWIVIGKSEEKEKEEK